MKASQLSQPGFNFCKTSFYDSPAEKPSLLKFGVVMGDFPRVHGELGRRGRHISCVRGWI